MLILVLQITFLKDIISYIKICWDKNLLLWTLVVEYNHYELICGFCDNTTLKLKLYTEIKYKILKSLLCSVVLPCEIMILFDLTDAEDRIRDFSKSDCTKGCGRKSCHSLLQSKNIIVDGSRGNKYTATFFLEKCVCLSLRTCFCIIAGHIKSVGMDISGEKKSCYLTQLGRNMKEKPDENDCKKIPMFCYKDDAANILCLILG